MTRVIYDIWNEINQCQGERKHPGTFSRRYEDLEGIMKAAEAGPALYSFVQHVQRHFPFCLSDLFRSCHNIVTILSQYFDAPIWIRYFVSWFQEGPLDVPGITEQLRQNLLECAVSATSVFDAVVATRRFHDVSESWRFHMQSTCKAHEKKT